MKHFQLLYELNLIKFWLFFIRRYNDAKATSAALADEIENGSLKDFKGEKTRRPLLKEKTKSQ